MEGLAKFSLLDISHGPAAALMRHAHCPLVAVGIDLGRNTRVCFSPASTYNLPGMLASVAMMKCERLNCGKHWIVGSRDVMTISNEKLRCGRKS